MMMMLKTSYATPEKLFTLSIYLSIYLPKKTEYIAKVELPSCVSEEDFVRTQQVSPFHVELPLLEAFVRLEVASCMAYVDPWPISLAVLRVSSRPSPSWYWLLHWASADCTGTSPSWGRSR